MGWLYQGLLLLTLDIALTYLVVDRIVAGQETRRRRATSSFAEARLLGDLDGLLFDALPDASRSMGIKVVQVRESTLTLKVDSVRDKPYGEVWSDDPRFAASGLADAIGRHGVSVRDPMIIAILEPQLIPAFVRLRDRVDQAQVLLSEYADRDSDEIRADLARAAMGVVSATLELREQICERW
jgi:hypothetical protein